MAISEYGINALKQKVKSGEELSYEEKQYIIKSLSKIKEYESYAEVFRSRFSEDALKILENKKGLGDWIDRGRWAVKKCDEYGRRLEQYEKQYGDFTDDLLNTGYTKGIEAGYEKALADFSSALKDKLVRGDGIIDDIVKSLLEKTLGEKAFCADADLEREV